MSREKILFVDDEPNILEGMQNQFRKRFEVSTAPGGEEGLKILAECTAPFAVVVSDMRMPRMNGAQFLASAHQRWPDTVRLLLTGNSDMDDAIKAVNEGNIFRFLTKPCPKEILSTALDAAVEQYHLIKAEEELLEKTVKGCVQVLTDMLAFANPLAISRTTRIRHYVMHLAKELGLEKIWQLEIAAMLSQIGCIAIPHDVMRKWEQGSRALAPEESAMLHSHPKIARDLIATIPRLQFVAEMVGHQNDVFKTAQADPEVDGAVLMGASILKVAVDLDSMMMRAGALAMAVGALERRARMSGEYNPTVVAALPRITTIGQALAERTVRVEDLQDGMILAGEVRTLAGRLLLANGQRVNALTRTHLQNHLTRGEIKNDIHVWVD